MRLGLLVGALIVCGCSGEDRPQFYVPPSDDGGTPRPDDSGTSSDAGPQFVHGSSMPVGTAGAGNGGQGSAGQQGSDGGTKPSAVAHHGYDPNMIWRCDESGKVVGEEASDQMDTGVPCGGETYEQYGNRMEAKKVLGSIIRDHHAVVHPTAGTMIIRIVDQSTWKGSLIRRSPPWLTGGDGESEPIDTDCESVGGVGGFLINPATADIYYACEGEKGKIHAVGASDPIEVPATLGVLLAVGFDGSWLYSCLMPDADKPQYCLRDADGKESVVVPRHPLDPEDLHIRAAEQGFLVLDTAADGIVRWSIGYDGRTGLDELYQPLPKDTGVWSCALWPDGDAMCRGSGNDGADAWRFEAGAKEVMKLRPYTGSKGKPITGP